MMVGAGAKQNHKCCEVKIKLRNQTRHQHQEKRQEIRRDEILIKWQQKTSGLKRQRD